MDATTARHHLFDALAKPIPAPGFRREERLNDIAGYAAHVERCHVQGQPAYWDDAYWRQRKASLLEQVRAGLKEHGRLSMQLLGWRH